MENNTASQVFKADELIALLKVKFKNKDVHDTWWDNDFLAISFSLNSSTDLTLVFDVDLMDTMYEQFNIVEIRRPSLREVEVECNIGGVFNASVDEPFKLAEWVIGYINSADENCFAGKGIYFCESYDDMKAEINDWFID